MLHNRALWLHCQYRFADKRHSPDRHRSSTRIGCSMLVVGCWMFPSTETHTPDPNPLGFSPPTPILSSGKWLSNPNRCSTRRSCASRCDPSKYRYAINLSCDWIIVTSMRETRLYYKGAHQQAYERFETVRLPTDEALLKRFVFLPGAERGDRAQPERS